MLCTDRLLAISQPKTGSTTRRLGFKWILGGREHLAHEGQRYEGHCPLHDVPSEAIGGRAVVATVRNPWDWYVSVFRHIHYHAKRGASLTRLWVWGRGEVSWEPVLYGMTHPWEMAEPIAENAVGAPGGLFPDKPWPAGLWSRSTHWFNAGADTWVDLASQNEVWATELAPEHADALRACPWDNQAMGGSSAGWTEEQIEWVGEADAEYIALFGYGGPGTTAREPIFRGALL